MSKLVDDDLVAARKLYTAACDERDRLRARDREWRRGVEAIKEQLEDAMPDAVMDIQPGNVQAVIDDAGKLLERMTAEQEAQAGGDTQ